MSIQVGDLIVLNSIKSVTLKSDIPAIVTEVIESNVFEGGEKCKILKVLPCDDSRVYEVMSWGVTKVNP